MANKYTVITGIAIEDAGISITGNQYVKIAAATNNYWLYDKNGFQHVNSSGHKFIITEASSFTDNAIKGAITYSSTTNGGSIRLFVRKADNSANANLYLETSSSSLVYLYATGTRFVSLGSLNHPFGDLYIQNIIARQFTSSGQIAGYHTRFYFGAYDPDGTTVYPYFELYALANDTNKNIHITNSGGLYFDYAIHGDYIYYGHLVQESSRDVKHNIVDLNDYGDKIDRLRPVSFIYNNDPKENMRAGLIYEETIDVMPEICIHDNDNKAINYVELIPIMLKEIQGLRNRVKTLEGTKE